MWQTSGLVGSLPTGMVGLTRTGGRYDKSRWRVKPHHLILSILSENEGYKETQTAEPRDGGVSEGSRGHLN